MAVHSTARSLPRPSETVQIVKAANNFLATLEAKQRQAVMYAFNDEQQRALVELESTVVFIATDGVV
jgi:hypothetical protein